MEQRKVLWKCNISQLTVFFNLRLSVIVRREFADWKSYLSPPWSIHRQKLMNVKSDTVQWLGGLPPTAILLHDHSWICQLLTNQPHIRLSALQKMPSECNRAISLFKPILLLHVDPAPHSMDDAVWIRCTFSFILTLCLGFIWRWKSRQKPRQNLPTCKFQGFQCSLRCFPSR